MENFTVVDYVWLGGNGELRSKSRVIYDTITSIEQIPIWNYDGSSTGQAVGDSSEILIHPKRIFRCPFRKPNGLIVICDTYRKDGTPALYNHRVEAQKIFNEYEYEKPWYGLEQEYFMYDVTTNQPLGFEKAVKQGQYYCSVGANNIFGRIIMDEHMDACLYAGIKISGTNAEVAPAQFEYQIGPVEGIDAADQLWVSRYILEKLTEKYDVYIVYHPKPLGNHWNGSGCHTNFSTENMRKSGGMDVILSAIDKLKNAHLDHMKVYGDSNEERMTGSHETADYNTFTSGIGDRTASIRIPNDTAINGYGYFEDRRPASNCDPYLVTSIILRTICL